MEQRKNIYYEDQYTSAIPLMDQEPPEAVNSILWRLAVALDFAEEGVDGMAFVDPDEVLELAEDVIWRYKELEK